MVSSKRVGVLRIALVLTLAVLAGVAFRTQAQPQPTPLDREALLAAIHATSAVDRQKISQLAEKIAKDEGTKAVPFFIGLIDADNSYETVYGIGYFHLRHPTGVPFTKLHDGAWWRRWWQANRQQFPEDVRDLEVPVFEKTAHGRRYIPFPETCETLAGKMELAANLFSGVEPRHADWLDAKSLLQDVVAQIAEHDDPAAIPFLIGLMDADNSSNLVSDIGRRALQPLTGVKFSALHDGHWWRRWWSENRQEFPAEVQALAIPTLPKTKFGQTYTPYPDDVDILQRKLKIAATIFAELKAQANPKAPATRLQWQVFSAIVVEIAGHGDAHAIPYLIGLIDADNTYETVYGVGYFGLGFGSPPLTDVKYDKSHDGSWWRNWWQENKSKYPADVQAIEIPDYRRPLAFNWKEPTKEEKELAKAEADKAAMADVADIPAQDLTLADNQRMRYFLIGPRAGAKTPEQGFKLVVVLPGGDGSADFHPFVRRLFKYAMNETYLVAQPVAVRSSRQQKVTWPTKHNAVKSQQFTTEQFVEAVIEDVAKRHKIDKRSVFTLSWSSGGPAAYAIALQERTAVTGSYIAMSVFRPEWHPHVERAKGRAFLLDHSPQDKICKFEFAEKAQRELTSAGGQVRLVTYEGGHGWHGNMYGRVADGLKWLVEQTERTPD